MGCCCPRTKTCPTCFGKGQVRRWAQYNWHVCNHWGHCCCNQQIWETCSTCCGSGRVSVTCCCSSWPIVRPYQFAPRATGTGALVL